MKDNRLYIGFTHDLAKRINEHNQGEQSATKNRRPFKLIYYEAYVSIKDAHTRETRLKKFKNSYAELKKRIEHSLT